MAYSETTNYDLRKPATTDPVDITLLNWNMDTIDSQMKTNNNAAIQAASSSQAGRMSAADYIKLNKQAIPSNADLNNYTTPGLYYTDGASVTASLSHCPASQRFLMKVYETDASTKIQEIIEMNEPVTKTYRRIIYSGSPRAWHRLIDTQTGESKTFTSIADANAYLAGLAKDLAGTISITLSGTSLSGVLSIDGFRKVDNFQAYGVDVVFATGAILSGGIRIRNCQTQVRVRGTGTASTARLERQIRVPSGQEVGCDIQACQDVYLSGIGITGYSNSSGGTLAVRSLYGSNLSIDSCLIEKAYVAMGAQFGGRIYTSDVIGGGGSVKNVYAVSLSRGGIGLLNGTIPASDNGVYGIGKAGGGLVSSTDNPTSASPS